jgi:hypothetical protein
MKSNSRNLLKAGIVVCLAALFIGTSAAAMVEPTSVTLGQVKAATGVKQSSSRDQIELGYYDPNSPGDVIGIQGGTAPYIWKTAIRLTQTELAPYKTWNITQVVIGFQQDATEGPMNVTIYIYQKGTATHPGSVIVHDTWMILNDSYLSLITVPLKTPVSLSVTGRDEVWVAVQYTQLIDSTYYAVTDTGPAVDQKGDWIYLNNAWSELQVSGSQYDVNWMIGAVVEGSGLAQIALANIKGPIGVKADVQNTGEVDATNVAWTITVTGGILGKVDKSATGSDPLLAAHATLPISLPLFIGFGKINIVITAKASNAQEITATKTAFLLGPIVLGVK